MRMSVRIFTILLVLTLVGTVFQPPASATTVTASAVTDNFDWTGASWYQNSALTDANLNRVVWAGDRFVAVGDAGVILTSADGIRWSRRTSGTFRNLKGIAYNGSAYVVVGDNSTVLVSTDAVTWTRIEGELGDLELNDITWGLGRFVAVGSGVLESQDGLYWNISEGYAPMNAVVANENMLVAAGGYHRQGKIIKSSDGITWNGALSAGLNTDRFHDVAWSGNQFLAVGGGYDQPMLWISADGTTWTDGINTWPDPQIVTVDGEDPWGWSLGGESMFAFSKIKWTGSQYLAIGGPLSWVDGPKPISLLTSPDGLSWSSLFWHDNGFLTRDQWEQLDLQVNDLDWIHDLAWNGSRFVIVGGQGRIITSAMTGDTSALLSELQVDGASIAGFDPALLYYQVGVIRGTTKVPVVTAQPADPAATVTVIPATGIPGITRVEVTAGDGTAQLTYHLRFAVASNLELDWQQFLGGTGDDVASSIRPTADGGYIIAGSTSSTDGDVSGRHPGTGSDAWVVKVNALGELEWQQCLGGSGQDAVTSVIQTADGDYIVAGYTNSNDGDVSGNKGGFDAWIAKLDSQGDKVWLKNFGGSGWDGFDSMAPTGDGGFVAAGATNNSGKNVGWVVKFNSQGVMEWQKHLESPWYGWSTQLNAVSQTADGGYILGGNYLGLVKLDAAGTIEWQKNIAESIQEVEQTVDGGYIVSANQSNSFAEVGTLFKLDAQGSLEWQKEFPLKDPAEGLLIATARQTSDGGYIAVGTTPYSLGEGYWVAKLDSSGVVEGMQTYGGSRHWPADVRETAAGGYIIAGRSRSSNYWYDEVWIAKIQPDPRVLSAANELLAFTVAPQSGDSMIDPVAHTVTVRVPPGTDVTALVPSITVANGASITPAAGVPQNFSNPVIYTVTAEDGSEQDWIVTLTAVVQQDITTFTLTGQTGPAVIDPDNQTVTIEVAAGTDVTALTPAITVSPGADIDPPSGAAHDFTHPVLYTVTAGGTGQAWTVTVTVADPPVEVVENKIAAGWGHSLALKADGTVTAWGYNGYGQIDVPEDLGNVVAVAAGRAHSLALQSDGTVAAWGKNDYGQLEVPSGLEDVVAVASVDHTLALQSDGTVTAWGSNDYGESEIPSGLEDVVAVAAGGRHSLALLSDGTVVAWGANYYGQIDVPAGLEDVVAITAGWDHSLALKSDGTVVAWGYNDFGQSSVPTGLEDVVAVAAGWDHSLALRSDGTVVAWGDNNYGESEVPSDLGVVVGITAGGYHSLALKADGSVVDWGFNEHGQSNVPEGLNLFEQAIVLRDITTFTLPEQTGPAVIGPANHTVTVQVKAGTDLTALTPVITVSPGADIDPPSGTARNFTEPVIYTVTTGGTGQNWTVTVTVAEPPVSGLVGRIGRTESSGITVSLTDPNDPDAIQTTSPTAGGSFAFLDPEPGNYQLTVSAPGYLTESRMIEVTALLPVDLGKILLRPGNLDGNNEVDIADLELLARSYGLEPGDPGFDTVMDFNGDEVLDLYDMVLLARNVNASTPNLAPVANAGPDQNVSTGNLVTMDGSGSFDADGDPPTYNWAFTARPPGSAATLTSSIAVNPTFTPDVDGDYVLRLIVNDGITDSQADTVTITALPLNAAPVADAGPDQEVVTGSLVLLDGSGSSDADGDDLTYSWSFTSKPGGSSATLSDSAIVNPSFIADLEGAYVLRLVVNDGIVDSAADTITVTAAIPNPDSSGEIIFISDRDGSFDVYKINLDSDELTRLTDTNVDEYDARWSPDGNSIVYMRNSEIWMMDSNGENQRYIINGKHPAFSPDGTKIAYSGYGGNFYGGYDLFVYDLNSKQNTKIYDSVGNNEFPDWSPNGQEIVFRNNFHQYGGDQKYIMKVNADGSNPVELTHVNSDFNKYAFASSPRWSPDGTKILYHYYDSDRFGNYEIHVMNADGSEKTRLTHDASSSKANAWAVWSPSGTQIVYLSGWAGSNNDIHIMNIDGSNKRSIMNTNYNYPTDWRIFSE